MTVREEIEGLPSEAAHAVVQAGRSDALLDLVDLWISYGVSSREALWRGDNFEAGLCLKRARLTFIESLSTFRLLAPNEAAATLNGKTEAGDPKKREAPE